MKNEEGIRKRTNIEEECHETGLELLHNKCLVFWEIGDGSTDSETARRTTAKPFSNLSLLWVRFSHAVGAAVLHH